MRAAKANLVSEAIADLANRLTQHITSWVNWHNSVYSTAFQAEVDLPAAINQG